jgi:hypothetical protein
MKGIITSSVGVLLLLVGLFCGVRSCVQYDMNRWAYNRGRADKENHDRPSNFYTDPGQRAAYWRGYEESEPDPRVKP